MITNNWVPRVLSYLYLGTRLDYEMFPRRLYQRWFAALRSQSFKRLFKILILENV